MAFYRCHVGHAYSADNLLVEQSEAVEEALYSALRALEEKANILMRVGARFGDNSPTLERQYQAKARELESSAAVIRQLLTDRAT